MKNLHLIMVISLLALTISLFYQKNLTAQKQQIMQQNVSDKEIKPSKVDFDAFEKLTHEVKEYRKNRLVDLETFLRYSKEKGVIILDTRSEKMFTSKHVKGSINLNFSDFTQNNLAKIIPDQKTKILIYCNNNFDNDEINFTSKSITPDPLKKEKELTLALNIPTFINLYGYGYKNVYELSELISVFDSRIKFEGTSISSNK